MAVTEREFNPSGHVGVDSIKAKALEMEEVIMKHTQPGRRRAIALTELESCSMFAVKSAVRGDE